MDVGIPDSTARGLLLLLIAFLLAMFIGAVLIGSIPLSSLVRRALQRKERTVGSERVIAVAGALVDALKGFAPTAFVVWRFQGFLDSPDLPPTSQFIGAIVAAGVLLGHCFSPWLRRRGGKGVATLAGATFGLCWPAGLIVVAVWALGVLTTRYQSAGSLLGGIAAPVALWLFTRSVPETLFGLLAAALIVLTHRENINRLRNGTEPRAWSGA